jgi:hypothetical protein
VERRRAIALVEARVARERGLACVVKLEPTDLIDLYED